MCFLSVVVLAFEFWDEKQNSPDLKARAVGVGWGDCDAWRIKTATKRRSGESEFASPYIYSAEMRSVAPFG
jgi:hypothetical protein